MQKKLTQPVIWLEHCGWKCNGKGWWTHTEYGRICQKYDKYWYAYPLSGGKFGPFRKNRDAAIHCSSIK